MTRLIALTGAAGVGKSYVARQAMCGGDVKVAFAEPLKKMMVGLLESSLGAVETARVVYGDGKEEPLAIFGGKSSRQAQQFLGTEWGRELIHPDLWVNVWKERVERLRSLGRDVVCDDLRFPNEALAVRELGGSIVQVVGNRATTEHSDHVSESYRPNPDFVIHNTGDREFLINQLNDIYVELSNE